MRVLQGEKLVKSGFTLIEIVVSLAIIAILTAFEGSILIANYNYYHSEIKRSEQNSYNEEFFTILEQLIYEDMKEIRINNNEIIVNCLNSKQKKIRYNPVNGKIFAYYYDEFGNDYYGAIVIYKGINNMILSKNDNVLYISITNNKGVTFSRCLGIKKIY